MMRLLKRLTYNIPEVALSCCRLVSVTPGKPISVTFAPSCTFIQVVNVRFWVMIITLFLPLFSADCNWLTLDTNTGVALPPPVALLP